MKVYEVYTNEDEFVVFASSEEEAIEIVANNHFDGDKHGIRIGDFADIKAGIIAHLNSFDDFSFGYEDCCS